MKKIVMIIMAVALIALPTMAQQQAWKSTSAMQTSGSTYTPQVNAVGATAVSSMATTTPESYTPAHAPASGPHKVGPPTPPTPIGDAMLPLMVFAAVFCGVITLRRKRSALNQ